MRRRLITSLALALIGLPAIIFGGILYFILMGTFLIGAAWEYVYLFRSAKFEPQLYITVGGAALICFTRAFTPDFAMPALTLALFSALAFHVIAYERGREHAAVDFAISAAGITYIGWLGSYLFDLRNLPDGGWWFMIVMPCLWLSDSGAYSIGRAYGKHKLAPRLSPKKSWEGYAASVFTGLISGIFFVYVYKHFGGFTGNITLWQGALIGLLMGIFPTIGDLGESMVKRQSGMKDSSDIIPGHGGFFDRIDSWIWGAPIGFYFIVWFIL